MTNNHEPRQGNGVAYLLMVMVALWSGVLSAGFVWAAASGELSATRALVFSVLAAFLALIAGRTVYELARRIRGARS